MCFLVSLSHRTVGLYLPLFLSLFLTDKGCIIPFAEILSAKSFNSSGLKNCRGVLMVEIMSFGLNIKILLPEMLCIFLPPKTLFYRSKKIMSHISNKVKLFPSHKAAINYIIFNFIKDFLRFYYPFSDILVKFAISFLLK